MVANGKVLFTNEHGGKPCIRSSLFQCRRVYKARRNISEDSVLVTDEAVSCSKRQIKFLPVDALEFLSKYQESMESGCMSE
jgi:hypothetical protein